VKIQTYDDTYKGDLIRIDKKSNSLHLGYDESEYKSCTTKFRTSIVLDGFIQIHNTTGLNIYSKRNGERTNLRCDDGGVYFMDYDSPSSGDIFFQKGLRFKFEESLKIQKPYTSYQSGVNNLETRLTTLESGSGSGSNNLITYRQSIIDHAILNNPNNTLYQLTMNEIKIYTPIKTLVGENIYPKTTHTLLTAYYSSYIENNNLPPSTNRKPLLRYYCTNETYPVIVISVIGTTYLGLPQLRIEIYNSNGDCHKEYILTANERKVVMDLTAELATVRPGKEIVSAQFALADFGGDSNEFYKHCVNILSNVFIFYTYEDLHTSPFLININIVQIKFF
jgi:hypothetical protein